MTDPTPEQIAEAKRVLEAMEQSLERTRHERELEEKQKQNQAMEDFRAQVYNLWPLQWEPCFSRGAAYVTIQVIPGVHMSIEQPEPDCKGFPCSIFASGYYPCKSSAKSVDDAVRKLRKALQDMGERMVRLANVKAKDTQ